MIRTPRRKRAFWNVESLEARTLLSVGGGTSGPNPFAYIASEVIVGYKSGGPDASTQALLNSWGAQEDKNWSTGTLYTLAPNVNTSQAISTLKQQSDVVYAEQNAVGQAAGNPPAINVSTLQAYLNKPSGTNPPNPTAIDAVDGWPNVTNSKGTPITVAVVDSGIDYTNPDLYLNMWLNPNAIPASIYSKIVLTDGGSTPDFYDLNSLNAAGQVVTNANGQPVNAGLVIHSDPNHPYIDAYDLINDPNWNNQFDANDGYTGDLIGYDITDGTNNPFDSTTTNNGNEGSHGTAVAGIIAGSGGANGIGGTQGIASGTTTNSTTSSPFPSAVRIMDIQAGSDGQFDNADLAAAIAYASENGAKVLVASIEGLTYSSAVMEAISAASSNMAIVFAAGNDATNLDSLHTSLNALTIPQPDPTQPGYNAYFPALYASLTSTELATLAGPLGAIGLTNSNVVVVANVQTNGSLDPSSNYGPLTVALAAPGDNILTTVQANDNTINGQIYYGLRSGTSFAAPMVAATLALRFYQHPTDPVGTVLAQVVGKTSTTPDNSLHNYVGTSGVLNVKKATLGGSSSGNPPAIYDSAGDAGQIVLNFTGNQSATSGNSMFPVGSPIFRSTTTNPTSVQIGTTGTSGFFTDSGLDPSVAYNYLVVVNGHVTKTLSAISPNLADTTKFLLTEGFNTPAPQPGLSWVPLGGSWIRSNGLEQQRESIGPSAGNPNLVMNTAAILPPDLDEEAKVRVDAFIDPTGNTVNVGLGLATDPTTGNGYGLVFASTATGQHVVEFVNSATGQVGNVFPFAWTAGAWYWFRLQAYSDQLLGQVWADGTAEPTTMTYAQPWSNNGGTPEFIGGAVSNGSSGFALASFDSFALREISTSAPLTSTTVSTGNNSGGSDGPYAVTIAPSVTTQSVSAPTVLPGAGGWYHTPVTVSLQASDRTFPSYAVTIQYSIDGGPEQPYFGPFTIFTDGIHTVTYTSFDPAHNFAQPQTITIKIDQAGPTITPGAASVQQATPLVARFGGLITVQGTFDASDSVSGVNLKGAKVSVTTSTGQPVVPLQPVAFTVNSDGSISFSVRIRVPAAPIGKSNVSYSIQLQVPNGAGLVSTRTLSVAPTNTPVIGPTSTVYKASWLPLLLAVVHKGK